MTEGHPIFYWIPGIPTTDQAYDEHQTEDTEIVSTHGNKDDDGSTKNGEEEKSTEEEAYAEEEQYEYS